MNYMKYNFMHKWPCILYNFVSKAPWPRSQAAVCKTAQTGALPVGASILVYCCISTRASGGIGIRDGLKIRWQKCLEGSSPSSPTKKKLFRKKPPMRATISEKVSFWCPCTTRLEPILRKTAEMCKLSPAAQRTQACAAPRQKNPLHYFLRFPPPRFFGFGKGIFLVVRCRHAT